MTRIAVPLPPRLRAIRGRLARSTERFKRRKVLTEWFISINELGFARNCSVLCNEIVPLTNTQIVDVLCPAQPAECVTRQVLTLATQIAPHIQKGKKIRLRVGEPRMKLIRLRLKLNGALARILNSQRRGNNDDLFKYAAARRLNDHASQARVCWNPRNQTADPREPALRVRCVRIKGAELVKKRDAVPNIARIWRFNEGEAPNLFGACRNPHRNHLQNYGRERRDETPGLGELWARLEIFGRVEPNRDAL